MTDTEFARSFERGDVPPAEFSHRSHIRLGWVYLQEGPSFDAALSRIRDGIQQFAAAAGKADKYHETITVAWMKLLAAAGERVGQTVAFDELLRLAPELGDKDLPLRYYTRDRLFSDAARGAWVPPDSPF
jgi:hypothetical protein